VSSTDAAVQSAAGQNVSHSDFCSESERVVEWKRMQERAESNVRRFLRDRTDQRERICRYAKIWNTWCSMIE
jgi:hypothetical protein